MTFLMLTIIKIFKDKNHFLMILLSLEMIMLISCIAVSTSALKLQMSFFILFFSLAVCEACVGLSCMVFLSRKSGNDLINRF